MYQVQVRADTRAVVQWGQVVYGREHLAIETDEDGTPVAVVPTIEVGLGARDGHAVETVSDQTMAAIHAAMPDHGGGVALSEDHSTVTPLPEPSGYQELLAAAARKQEALEALQAHAVANPEDPTAILARALGLV